MEQRECVCLSHRTGKRAAQINLQSFSGSRAELKVRDGHAWYTVDDRRVCKTNRQLLFWPECAATTSLQIVQKLSSDCIQARSKQE